MDGHRESEARSRVRRRVPWAALALLAASLTWGTGSALAAAGATEPATAATAWSPAATGLASPPSWAAGRRVAFEPSAGAAASAPDLLAAALDERPPHSPPPPGLLIGPIFYNEGGGGVQHSPHVYAIFWGSNWNKAPGSEAKAEVLKLYEGLSKSAYEGILTQYFDATGRISNTVAVTAYVDTGVAAPAAVNDAKVQAEVAHAVEANKWTVALENQFVVLSAPGSTFEAGFANSFCAYHGLTSKEGTSGAVYAYVPYQGDEPFLANCLSTDVDKSPVNKTSKSASHEFAESATDPDLNTWYGPAKAEIADICSEEKDLELPDGAWAQNLFDDHLNVCAHEDLEPPHVYAVSKGATEVTATAAKLEGTVNPESVETTYTFEYGTTKTYGSKTTVTSAGSSVKNQAVSATLTGLKEATEYHYRVSATNSTGTTTGKDEKFTTG
jgi:hypothetical protein